MYSKWQLKNVKNIVSVALSIMMVSSLCACSGSNATTASPTPTAAVDSLGILSRLNHVQSNWSVDEVNNLTSHSIAVYASPGNQGCFVWVFNDKSKAEEFGSNAVANAATPPMYWYGLDKVSKKQIVLLSMGGETFHESSAVSKCESAMETTFDIKMLSSLD